MDPKEKIVLTMANVLVRNTLVDLIVMNARLVTAWMVSQHVRSVFFLFFVHLQKILSYSKYIVLHENCKKMGCKLNVSFPGTQYHGTGFCQGQVHTVPNRTSACRARVLWNCMNESLAEPVPWYWVPGRGILRHHSLNFKVFKKSIF